MTKETLIERIKTIPPNRECNIGIPGNEMTQGIIEFFNSKDMSRMKELKEVYTDWNIKSRGEIYRKEVTEENIGMFDWHCQIADDYLKTKDLDKAFRAAFGNPFLPVGPVRRFYRNSIQISDVQMDSLHHKLIKKALENYNRGL